MNEMKSLSKRATLSPILTLMFHINRIGSILFWSGVGFLCLLVVHDLFWYIDRYPYLALDDSLVNVAFALAKEGRYGFLASPLQAPHDWLRHQGFFNYGPWYFYVSGFLIWLFGYSLALIRSVHLFSIFTIIVLSYFWFKRNGSSLPAAFTALGVLVIFQSAHWPMVRPDVFVSLFASLFVIAAGNAIQSSHNHSWFWVGLFATCAALTHLIAWAMVPAAFFVWLRNEYRLSGEIGYNCRPSEIGRRFIWLAAGGLMGALMFYASFDFRIRDHLATLIAYRAQADANTTSAAHGLGLYFEVLAKHISSAFGFLSPRAKNLVLATPVLGWGLLFSLLLWGPAQIRRLGEALVFPPLVVLSAYVLSLGTYPNFHAGYAILTQIMFCWLLASIIGVGQLWLASFGKWIAAACTGVTIVAGLIVTAGMVRTQLQESSFRSVQGSQWVPISELMRESVGDIPKRGSAWGSVVFGAENPAVVQLIQFGEAARLMSAVSLSERQRLAPDYLFWGYPENRDSTLAVLQGGAGHLTRIHELLPGEHYKLAKLIYAKPYGATRIYQRIFSNGASVSPSPQIAMFRAGPDYWLRPDWRALNVVFEPATPVRLGIGYDASPSLVSARSTLRASIPAGDYVFRVSLKQSADVKPQPGFVTITDQIESREQISELGPSGDVAPHLSDETEVFLTLAHSGGDAYLSYYGGKGFEISKVEAFSLRGADEPLRVKERAAYTKLPDFANWVPSVGVNVAKEGPRYKMVGDNTQWGYQLSSQAIAVSPNSAVVVRLDYEVVAGKICVGILDEKSSWLVAADRSERVYEFNSGSNSSLRIVFANCNQQKDGNKVSRVLLNDSTYRVVSSPLYTDDLVSEFKKSAR